MLDQACKGFLPREAAAPHLLDHQGALVNIVLEPFIDALFFVVLSSADRAHPDFVVFFIALQAPLVKGVRTTQNHLVQVFELLQANRALANAVLPFLALLLDLIPFLLGHRLRGRGNEPEPLRQSELLGVALVFELILFLFQPFLLLLVLFQFSEVDLILIFQLPRLLGLRVVPDGRFGGAKFHGLRQFRVLAQIREVLLLETFIL